MDKTQLVQTLNEILRELKMKYSWNGRAYIVDMITELYQSTETQSNTKLYRKVVEQHAGINVDAVERCVRHCFEHLDYSTPLAQKIFPLSEKESKVTNKEGIYAILHELKQRLN